MLLAPTLIVTVGVAVLFHILFMQPRRFYFIRHGETLLNAQHRRQGEEGELSENGRRQAEEVGAHLKSLPVERIISSTYPRARETAEILHKYLKVPVLYSPLLVERRNPKEIVGKSTSDPEVIRIVDQMDLAYHEDDYRFSDEENFVDLKGRAKKCIDLLARQGTREMVVVTHHIFLKMLLSYMLYREGLHNGDYTKLSFFNISDNAGISICEFHPWKMFNKTRGWSVISFNEQP